MDNIFDGLEPRCYGAQLNKHYIISSLYVRNFYFD